MFKLTGQPGWMCFGFSPGWLGRSGSDLGPCAQYLMTGQFPGSKDTGEQIGVPFAGWMSQDPNAKIECLKNQLNLLEQRIADVKS